jgi:hypothetical protein
MDKQITITGFVKEIGANWKAPRVCVVTADGIYLVTMKAEGKNLHFEVGNRVEATGTISKTRDGFQRISVSGYEVFEMNNDYHQEFGYEPEHDFGNNMVNGEPI